MKLKQLVPPLINIICTLFPLSGLERGLGGEVSVRKSSNFAQLVAMSAPCSRAAAVQRQYRQRGGTLPYNRCTLRRSPSQPPTMTFATCLPPSFPPTPPTAIVQFANLLHLSLFHSSLISSLVTRHFFYSVLSPQTSVLLLLIPHTSLLHSLLITSFHF